MRMERSFGFAKTAWSRISANTLVEGERMYAKRQMAVYETLRAEAASTLIECGYPPIMTGLGLANVTHARMVENCRSNRRDIEREMAASLYLHQAE